MIVIVEPGQRYDLSAGHDLEHNATRHVVSKALASLIASGAKHFLRRIDEARGCLSGGYIDLERFLRPTVVANVKMQYDLTYLART